MFKCETTGGCMLLFIHKFKERILRANLLQPLNSIEAINERLDAVQEILANKSCLT